MWKFTTTACTPKKAASTKNLASLPKLRYLPITHRNSEYETQYPQKKIYAAFISATTQKLPPSNRTHESDVSQRAHKAYLKLQNKPFKTVKFSKQLGRYHDHLKSSQSSEADRDEDLDCGKLGKKPRDCEEANVMSYLKHGTRICMENTARIDQIEQEVKDIYNGCSLRLKN